MEKILNFCEKVYNYIVKIIDIGGNYVGNNCYRVCYLMIIFIEVRR